MATSHKVTLKAAKAALDSGKYDEAVEQASKVLQADPTHYHANVFRGLALEKQGQHAAAEEAYNAALKSKRDDSLAWQGLIALYQQQASKKIDEYATAAQQLTEIHMRADDILRSQTVLDKYVAFAKQNGTKDQYRAALELMLPTSPLYDYLQGRIPHPGITYPKIAEITEAEEKQRINKLVGERKTRLGARIGQVSNEVKREVFGSSNLESIYEEVINWTTDDDIRRMYEEKLLQRAYDNLVVAPANEKQGRIGQVQELAQGMVILKHPFHLAWKIALEWKDIEDIKDLDINILLQFIELFPSDGFSKILTGFLQCGASPFSVTEQDLRTLNGLQNQDFVSEATGPTEEDQLIAMTDGLGESSRSLLSQRIMATYYSYLQEFTSAAETARNSKELLQAERQTTGLPLQQSLDAINIILGNALVHHQAPRHHKEARQLFEDILIRKPHNVPSSIGIGLIYEEEEDYALAADFLSKTLQSSPNAEIKAEAAWCMALGGDYAAGFDQIEESLHELEETGRTDKIFKAQCLYRLGMCKWNLDTPRTARKDRKGAYSYFLAALQQNLNYAPAYTSLGIFYSDYGKDSKRARKCFQKAFELSSTEVEAAERLAKSFAEQGEWDLVEVVAQRVIDSGKTRPPPGSKKRGIGWPFAALGVCQINNLDYAKSIVSFQAALRSHPQDVHSWIGLGESYHNSGRYISAAKAFEQVQALRKDADTGDDALWFSQYMLSNVRRELGQFTEAIEGFNTVLSLKPTDVGVSMALLQTYVEAGWHSLELGLFGRAAEHGTNALETAKGMVLEKPQAFNLWKAVEDACTIFTWIGSWHSALPQPDLLFLLQTQATEEHYATVTEDDQINLSTLQTSGQSEIQPIEPYIAAIFASKRAIYCSSHDFHAQAVAWYNLGWSEYRAHGCQAPASAKTTQKKGSAFLRAAVKCFKRAIELEPGNSEFWNSLGIVTTPLNPRVAQHAFCRSLFLNTNSARVWTNLGTLYLLEHDFQLAAEALTRGLSTDPEYAPAWLGQGLLSLLSGEEKEAQSHFEHAFEVSDSANVVAKRLYVSSTFDQLQHRSNAESDLAYLLQPLFALQQLKLQEPNNVICKHLSSLLTERIGGTYESVDNLQSVCRELETRYELSETDEDLERFVQAQADLSRANLAQSDFESASKNALISLDLTGGMESAETASGTLNGSRISAQLTSGLAYHFSGQSTKAIAMFRATLMESKSSPDIVCMLAEVLWAKGGEEERTAAREQLLDCIENNPDHAGTIVLLFVMAVIDGDQETLDAVSTDLHNLRSRADIDDRYKLKIGSLLSASAAINTGLEYPSKEMLADGVTSVMLAPGEAHSWVQLAAVTDQETYPSEMGVLTALTSAPPKGVLAADDLAQAHANTGKPSDAQRSIMMAPWQHAGWESLQYYAKYPGLQV